MQEDRLDGRSREAETTQRQSAVVQDESRRLDLGKLELVRRLSQYAAVVVLIVVVVLIGLSWRKLSGLHQEIETATKERDKVRAETDQLRTEASKLKKDNDSLKKTNGDLGSANKTLNEVADSLSKKSPEEVKVAFETSLAMTKDPEQIPPRIYIQIGDESEREKARAVVQQLRKKGYLVPGIENVGGKVPTASQLRYYPDDSFAQADSKDIISTLAGMGIKADAKGSLRGSDSSHRPRHYELWFGKDF